MRPVSGQDMDARKRAGGFKITKSGIVSILILMIRIEYVEHTKIGSSYTQIELLSALSNDCTVLSIYQHVSSTYTLFVNSIPKS